MTARSQVCWPGQGGTLADTMLARFRVRMRSAAMQDRPLMRAVTVAGLDAHWVLEGVWVGPCLQVAGDIDALASAGITAVLNLQTDEDLRDRGVDLDRLFEPQGR